MIFKLLFIIIAAVLVAALIISWVNWVISLFQGNYLPALVGLVAFFAVSALVWFLIKRFS